MRKRLFLPLFSLAASFETAVLFFDSSKLGFFSYHSSLFPYLDFIKILTVFVIVITSGVIYFFPQLDRPLLIASLVISFISVTLLFFNNIPPLPLVFTLILCCAFAKVCTIKIIITHFTLKEAFTEGVIEAIEIFVFSLFLHSSIFKINYYFYLTLCSIILLLSLIGVFLIPTIQNKNYLRDYRYLSPLNLFLALFSFSFIGAYYFFTTLRLAEEIQYGITIFFAGLVIMGILTALAKQYLKIGFIKIMYIVLPLSFLLQFFFYYSPLLTIFFMGFPSYLAIKSIFIATGIMKNFNSRRIVVIATFSAVSGTFFADLLFRFIPHNLFFPLTITISFFAIIHYFICAPIIAHAFIVISSRNKFSYDELELEFIHLIANGYSRWQTKRIMCLSPQDYQSIKQNILRKSHTKSLHQFLRLFYQ